MGKETFFDIFREWVGGVAFSILLWSLRMTKEQYWNEMEAQAIRQKEDLG